MTNSPSRKGKIIGVTALVSVALTTIVTVTVEATWKPAANYVVDNLVTTWTGERWVGVYSEPKVPNSTHRPEEQANVANLPHQVTSDEWTLSKSSNGILRASYIEDSYKFETVGFAKNEALVIALRGPDKGRGVIHLEKTQLEYYRGYATLCDCTSPVPQAVMVCPYVLYKPTDTEAARLAKSDPFLEQRCVSMGVGSGPQISTLSVAK